MAEKSKLNDGTKLYEVGYCRPPTSGQFPKGRSGNPKGRAKGARRARPKATQSLNAKILEQLDKVVIVREGGVRREITMRDRIAEQLVEQAASGQSRSLNLLMQLVAHADEDRVRAFEEGAAARERVRQKLEAMARRLREEEV